MTRGMKTVIKEGIFGVTKVSGTRFELLHEEEE